mgnify:CR=1 FL=1
MYRKIGQLSLRKNKGKVANDYLTQTNIKKLLTFIVRSDNIFRAGEKNRKVFTSAGVLELADRLD